MQPLLYLALVLLANLICLGGLFMLRTRERRRREHQAAFLASWRPVMMQWSLGNPVPLPLKPAQGYSRREKFWLLRLWNDLRQSVRGESSAYLSGLLHELGLRAELFQLLSSRQAGEKVAAVQAFGYLQDPSAWDPLVELALTGDSMLAFQALRSLLMISAEAAVPVLLEVLRKHRDWSRSRLLGTLRRLPSLRLVKPLGDALLEALDQGDLELAKDLALLLGTLRYPAMLPYMREILLRAPSPALLDVSAEILGDMRDPVALPALEGLAAHSDNGLRKTVVTAIGKMASSAQIPVLLQALDDTDWWVVYAAVDALHRIPGIRPEKLAELYTHPQTQVRDAMQYHQESANLNDSLH